MAVTAVVVAAAPVLAFGFGQRVGQRKASELLAAVAAPADDEAAPAAAAVAFAGDDVEEDILIK